MDRNLIFIYQCNLKHKMLSVRKTFLVSPSIKQVADWWPAVFAVVVGFFGEERGEMSLSRKFHIQVWISSFS